MKNIIRSACAAMMISAVMMEACFAMKDAQPYSEADKLLLGAVTSGDTEQFEHLINSGGLTPAGKNSAAKAARFNPALSLGFLGKLLPLADEDTQDHILRYASKCNFGCGAPPVTQVLASGVAYSKTTLLECLETAITRRYAAVNILPLLDALKQIDTDFSGTVNALVADKSTRGGFGARPALRTLV
ncbi:hypothetical protein FACS189449_03650 [Alphaproteobacteria bacterium]|nr:hypothetical protein FACS189449_03650 [Alphaproteobacteria bacterium]